MSTEIENVSQNIVDVACIGTQKHNVKPFSRHCHTSSSNMPFKRMTPSQLVLSNLSLDMPHRPSRPSPLEGVDTTSHRSIDSVRESSPVTSISTNNSRSESGTLSRQVTLPREKAATDDSAVFSKSRRKRKNIKILVIGNAKCGKSSLISRYAFGTFDEGYRTTIGADFIRKDIVHYRRGGTGASTHDPDAPVPDRVRLQLWDIAGQDRFQKLTRAYFADAQGVVIVCDVTRENTIDDVRKWRKAVSEWTDQYQAHLPIVLFANKADALQGTHEAFKMGGAIEKLCRDEGISGWFTTSARTGESVDEGFHALLEAILPTPSSPTGSSACVSTSQRENDSVGDHSSGYSVPAEGREGSIRLSPMTQSPPTRTVNADSCC